MSLWKRKTNRRRSEVLAFLLLVVLTGCAPLAQVRAVRPKFHPAPAASARLQQAERAIVAGQQLQRSDPVRATGLYLSAIEAATRELRKHQPDPRAMHDYNFALSRMLSIVRQARLDPWTHPLSIPAPNSGRYVLTQQRPKDSFSRAQDYDLIPADELDVQGRFVARRVARSGIGAPLVAIRTPQAAAIRQPFLLPRIYAPATAVANFSSGQCEIEFVDPLTTETANVAGRSFACAADFTAPLAVGLARERPEKIGLPAMLNPGQFADKAQLVRLQAYDPAKIPVLFVHGLQSTPVSWVPMASAIWADSVLRRRYQVWVFTYPTGYPVPYSALLLRRQLHAVEKLFSGHRPIVLVGHSMGGILSRLMISDSDGDKIWRYFFGKSPAETSLSPEGKALLREALIFKPEPGIGRAIFISTPHRGSVIAQGPIGRLASGVIHRPAQYAALSREVFAVSVVQKNDPGVLKLQRTPVSIDTLSPNDAWVKISSTLSMAKGVRYHSIIGDRGRRNTPNSSDGVVPYWSSHLHGAESEKIVPSDHGANQNPEAVRETVRILKKNVAGKTSGDEKAASPFQDE